MSSILSNDQLNDFKEKGFCIIKDVIPEDLVRDLQQECLRFMKEKDDEMEKKGVEMDEINHKGRRYFVAMRYKESEPMKKLMFSDALADITTKILGDDVYLFLEQYVVKGPDKRTKFSWHQDSGYLDFKHKPYLSIWCALDDVYEENGTVYLLPYDKAGTKDRIEHELEASSNDRIGYFGEDPGVPAIVKAGDVAIFSSTCFHRSGPNLTDKMRRVLLIQYSADPILKQNGEPLYWVEPFVKDGKKVQEVPTMS